MISDQASLPNPCTASFVLQVPIREAFAITLFLFFPLHPRGGLSDMKPLSDMGLEAKVKIVNVGEAGLVVLEILYTNDSRCRGAKGGATCEDSPTLNCTSKNESLDTGGSLSPDCVCIVSIKVARLSECVRRAHLLSEAIDVTYFATNSVFVDKLSGALLLL
ncbi:hypothetical protein RJT34_07025 [Clitoria ternatea]|uniref:Uncharacterized protein n=1 Tax=Clitoria ternatea TaxID=43366 RepID=A0AAN9K296_CLITE